MSDVERARNRKLVFVGSVRGRTPGSMKLGLQDAIPTYSNLFPIPIV